MAIEDVATKVENNGDGTCTWRVNFNMTIDEQMVADMKRQMFAQMSADMLELQQRCNASSSRLADGSATFAHIRAQRAQAALVASIRSEWDNLPDAEPAGILKR